MLHGFGSTRDDFAALVTDLARDFEVYTIDLPGRAWQFPGDRAPAVGPMSWRLIEVGPRSDDTRMNRVSMTA